MTGNTGIVIDSTELLQNFRAARHKREQIQIEADLHCCAPRAIAYELWTLGALDGTGISPGEFSDVYEPIPPAEPRTKSGRPRKGGHELSFDAEEARRMFAQGLTYGQMAQKLHCSRSAINHWAVYNGLRRQKTKGENDVKKERPAEETLLDKETETERHARIMESVDAGKRKRKAALPKSEPRQAEPRIATEPRGPMTVKGFRMAMCSLLSDTLDGAALSINGETVCDIYGVEISVRNNEVYVDLRTREASA